MWKLSCIVLSLITIGNSTAHDHPGTTEISRKFRNYEKQRYDSESSRSSIEYVNDDEDNDRHSSSEDYSRSDSEEFEGDKLIGKWRNSGSALEPKWRDGDSLPLVPFNDAPKQKKFTVHDVTNEETKLLETSRVTARFNDPEEPTNRGHNEETKIPISLEYQPAGSDKTEDRYSLEDDYERLHNPYPSRNRDNGFSRREKSTRFPTMTREVTKNLKDSTSKAEKRGNKELSYSIDEDEITSRLRYRDTFQAHPNEYELMEEDEEEYQKPRPRKRRPPQNYEFHENRPPTYSITWSTERYTESMGNLDKFSTRKLETTTTRRGPSEKRKSVNRDEGAMDSPRSSENAELRSLLKMQQIEGLSLSELLQRRNLTLNDLLRGKPEVLKALKSSENDSTEIIGRESKIYEPDILANSTERNKWQTSQSTRDRTTNSTFNEISTISKNENDVGINETTGERDENESMENMDSAETEAGRTRSNENEKLSAIVRLTKPIILPRLNFLTDKTRILGARTNQLAGKKDESVSNLDDDEIMEFSDFSMRKIEATTRFSEEPRSNGSIEKFDEDSGSTLSIENILSPTQQTAATLTINETSDFADTKVNTVTTDGNNSDVFRILDFDYQSDESRGSIKDEIVKINEEIVIDSEELTMSDEPYEKTTLKIDEFFHDNEDSPPKNHQIFPTNGKPYEVVISEIEPEARAEIFELFSSGSSAKRLERLLKSRNMSIDELIALRQRGSSKVHLAEVSRSREEMTNSRNYKTNDRIIGKSSIDETTTEIQLLRETTTEDLSNIEIDSTTRETTEPEAIEEQTNISSIGTDLSRNDEKNEQLLQLLRAFDSLPFSVPPESVGTVTSLESTIVTTHRTEEDVVEGKKIQDFSRNLVEIGLVEEILEKDSTTIDHLTETNIFKNYSTTRSTDERKNLSKVRPSIIASGAILGVTIVVFLGIFVVCRIRQKQKYTYRNTFSRAVFQGPAMTARKLSNSSSLNTIMVNVVATSTTKRPERRDNHENDENFEPKNDIENDSLDANDSWETIPDFMK